MNWEAILRACGVRADVAERWAPAFAVECAPERFSKGRDELPDFLGQILHESAMLTSTEENLRYSTAARIKAVWPIRFPTIESAEPYVRNPQALAEKVYGGRMGNKTPADAWECRGSGVLQVTGMDNLTELARHMGYANPYLLADDLRSQPAVGLRAAVLWWEGHIPDYLMGDCVRITKRVNGGLNGLDDRERLVEAARLAIEAA